MNQKTTEEIVKGLIMEMNSRKEDSYYYSLGELELTGFHNKPYTIELEEYHKGFGRSDYHPLYQTEDGQKCVEIFELLNNELAKQKACNAVVSLELQLEQAKDRAKKMGC